MASRQRSGGGGHQNGGNGGDSKRPVVSFGPYPTGSAMIEVSVWENEVGEGDDARTVHSVTTRRSSYDDSKKEWKESDSLRLQDIPFLILALKQAFEWIANDRLKK
jgi:hypothetical protein